MTPYIQEVIPRNIPAEVQEELNKCSGYIEEYVNYGSQILNTELKENTKSNPELALALMFRNFLDLADAISILVKNCSINPSKMQLRGLLETMFGIEYLLGKNMTERAYSFLICFYREKIKMFDLYDPNTKIGAEFFESLKADKLFDNFRLSAYENLIEEKQGLVNTTNSDEYRKYNEEYNRTQSKKVNKGKTFAWYSLFDGPTSVKKLSVELNHQSLYKIIYSNLSDAVHGADIITGKVFYSSDGDLNVSAIRNPKDIDFVLSLTCSLMSFVFRLFIAKRLPHRMRVHDMWHKSIRQRLPKSKVQK